MSSVVRCEACGQTIGAEGLMNTKLDALNDRIKVLQSEVMERDKLATGTVTPFLDIVHLCIMASLFLKTP